MTIWHYHLTEKRLNVKYVCLKLIFVATINILLLHWILYIYCPVLRETQRFVPPRKFKSLEGDMNFLGGTNLHVSRQSGQLIVYYTESCSTTLYSAERCAMRHDRETRRLEGDTTMYSPSAWLLWTNHISLFVISIIWGIIRYFDSLGESKKD